ncbi:MAG: DUF4116 domain-containing protein [Legionella sp.]|nr:DUF4116 domain-containing protein [Legionella sp.]
MPSPTEVGKIEDVCIMEEDKDLQEYLQISSENLLDEEEADKHGTAVSQNGLALEHAPLAVRSDIFLVCTAVSQNGQALKFASDKLKTIKYVVFNRALA